MERRKDGEKERRREGKTRKKRTRQAKKKPADICRLHVAADFRRKIGMPELLGRRNCAHRADVCACAAVNAHIRINLIDVSL